ncbi:MAG: sporulation transcriptional regulator SpoIIID [Clostridia bacterium]|nr:sporulation transcriptional regulator SpoIIID [Clostridiales bacterium]MDD7165307.1 sporulation transcriptional regulator SpoIIID [Clostridia bacterium]
MLYNHRTFLLKKRHKATVRSTAKVFGVSKSTIHHDVTAKLKYIDEYLYDEVKKLLQITLSERHIRGGIATRRKYKY